MTFDELDRLGSLPEVEIGVHTQTHAVLPLLPDGEVRKEILGSYHILRERYAVKAVPLLAFPFGLFDGRTARLASDVCGWRHNFLVEPLVIVGGYERLS